MDPSSYLVLFQGTIPHSQLLAMPISLSIHLTLAEPCVNMATFHSLESTMLVTRYPITNQKPHLLSSVGPFKVVTSARVARLTCQRLQPKDPTLLIIRMWCRLSQTQPAGSETPFLLVKKKNGLLFARARVQSRMAYGCLQKASKHLRKRREVRHYNKVSYSASSVATHLQNKGKGAREIQRWSSLGEFLRRLRFCCECYCTNTLPNTT